MRVTRNQGTSYQRRGELGLPDREEGKTRKKNTDPRTLVQSSFLITINTNLSFDDNDEADVIGEKMRDLLDALTYEGEGCSTWGKFFKVNPKGSKYKKYVNGNQPNPDYDEMYNNFYAEDDKQGEEHWCSFLEHIHVEGAGVEWAPGTKKNSRNQNLHAHMFLKIKHRTRLLIDTAYVQKYFQEHLQLPHRPYVHADYVHDTTQRVVDYVMKNAHNRNSQAVQQRGPDFFKVKKEEY